MMFEAPCSAWAIYRPVYHRSISAEACLPSSKGWIPTLRITNRSRRRPAHRMTEILPAKGSRSIFLLYLHRLWRKSAPAPSRKGRSRAIRCLRRRMDATRRRLAFRSAPHLLTERSMTKTRRSGAHCAKTSCATPTKQPTWARRFICSPSSRCACAKKEIRNFRSPLPRG